MSADCLWKKTSDAYKYYTSTPFHSGVSNYFDQVDNESLAALRLVIDSDRQANLNQSCQRWSSQAKQRKRRGTHRFTTDHHGTMLKQVRSWICSWVMCPPVKWIILFGNPPFSKKPPGFQISYLETPVATSKLRKEFWTPNVMPAGRISVDFHTLCIELGNFSSIVNSNLF